MANWLAAKKTCPLGKSQRTGNKLLLSYGEKRARQRQFPFHSYLYQLQIGRKLGPLTAS
jgi:hypothetical protein